MRKGSCILKDTVIFSVLFVEYIGAVNITMDEEVVPKIEQKKTK